MQPIGYLVWHRGDVDIPCYYYGPTDDPKEGWVGKDPRCRPIALGPGEYTCVYGHGDCEPLEIAPIDPA